MGTGQQGDQASKRVLICGDVNGKLNKLYHDVSRLQEKHGTFDFLLCTGKFLPPDKCEEFQDFISGQKEIPIETYFIDSESQTFCTHATSDIVPLGKTKKIYFLGTHGVKDIHGVRIAHLCGKNPSTQDGYYAQFRNKRGEPAFGSNFYNAGVIEHLKSQKGIGVDILLTSEWPANVLEHTDLPAQVEHSSVPVAEVADFLEPRFHACALANRFLRRVPYLSSQNKIVCRLIGLGVFDRREDQVQQKALHALIVCPFDKAKASLFKDSDQATPCPFLNLNVPDADKWLARPQGDLVIRSGDDQKWVVQKDVIRKASGILDVQVKNESGNGIIFKDPGEVVEAFLQYIYRNYVDQEDPMILVRLMMMADREEIDGLTEECNRLLMEKDFPTKEEVVEIMRVLKANKTLATARKWQLRLRDTIRNDIDLIEALIGAL